MRVSSQLILLLVSLLANTSQSAIAGELSRDDYAFAVTMTTGIVVVSLCKEKYEIIKGGGRVMADRLGIDGDATTAAVSAAVEANLGRTSYDRTALIPEITKVVRATLVIINKAPRKTFCNKYGPHVVETGLLRIKGTPIQAEQKGDTPDWLQVRPGVKAVASGPICSSIQAYDRSMKGSSRPLEDEKPEFALKKNRCSDETTTIRIASSDILRPNAIREDLRTFIKVEDPNQKWQGVALADMLMPIVPINTVLYADGRYQDGKVTILQTEQRSDGKRPGTPLANGDSVRVIQFDEKFERVPFKVEVTSGLHAGKQGWVSSLSVVLKNGRFLSFDEHLHE